MTRLLITGGCGYVGRELVKSVMGGYEVHVVDNLRSGGYRLRQMDLSKFNLHVTDIRDNNAVARLMEQVNPDVIIHLAAVHFIPECENDPQLAVSTNVQGTINLLHTAPQRCKFISISSAAVYAPNFADLHEGSPIGPTDIYGWTKLQSEEYAKYYGIKRNLRLWIVRLFNVIGPGETNPHVVPEIISQLKSGCTTLRLGNITPKRDFVDVHDVAEGLMRLIETEPVDNPAINLGTGNAYSVQNILDGLKRVSHIEFTVEQDPQRMRKSDRPILVASTEKLQRCLGWKPTSELQDILYRLWQTPDLPSSLIDRYRL